MRHRSYFCHQCKSTTDIDEFGDGPPQVMEACFYCASPLIELVESPAQSSDLQRWYGPVPGLMQPAPGAMPPSFAGPPAAAPAPGAVPNLIDLLRSELAFAQVVPRVQFFGPVPMRGEAYGDLLHRLFSEHQPNAVPTPPDVIANLPTRQNGVPAGVEEECVVCQEQMSGDSVEGAQLVVTQLPCNHWFHEQCIRPWLERSQTCPSCRHNVIGS